MINEIVPGQNSDKIHKFHEAHSLGGHNIGSQCVEERQQGQETELSDGGGEEADLPLGGEIRVPVGSAQKDVMISMISSEGDGTGNPLTKIGKNADTLVSYLRSEASKVCDVMNEDKKTVSDGAANEICESGE